MQFISILGYNDKSVIAAFFVITESYCIFVLLLLNNVTYRLVHLLLVHYPLTLSVVYLCLCICEEPHSWCGQTAENSFHYIHVKLLMYALYVYFYSEINYVFTLFLCFSLKMAFPIVINASTEVNLCTMCSSL